MLTESSYLTGLYTYVGAALALLLCVGWWLGRHWRASWATLVVLVGAALLLTPAYPKEGVTTLAPALVVAGFQLALEGPEAAEHAIRPLAMTSGLAVAVSVLLGLTVFRRKGSSGATKKEGKEKAS